MVLKRDVKWSYLFVAFFVKWTETVRSKKILLGGGIGKEEEMMTKNARFW